MCEGISWTEFPSECCKNCGLNITKLHAFNPACVHCTRVKFVRQDLFIERNREEVKNDKEIHN